MGLLRSEDGGFSLVELLVALGIFAAVVMSIIGLFSESINLNASGQDYTTVNSLARDKLEALVALPFADPQLTIPTGTTEVTFPNDLPADMPLERTYRVREFFLHKLDDVGTPDQQLSTPVQEGLGNIKEITVTVRSKRILFGNREIIASTFKTDGLLQ
jgi:type II secretory pathway pseudopilin PulG